MIPLTAASMHTSKREAGRDVGIAVPALKLATSGHCLRGDGETATPLKSALDLDWKTSHAIRCHA